MSFSRFISRPTFWEDHHGRTITKPISQLVAGSLFRIVGHSRSGLGALDPSRHAERAESFRGRLEEGPRAIGIARRATPQVHKRFVVVGHCAQRPGSLLIEYLARLCEPSDGFVAATLKRAEMGQC